MLVRKQIKFNRSVTKGKDGCMVEQGKLERLVFKNITGCDKKSAATDTAKLKDLERSTNQSFEVTSLKNKPHCNGNVVKTLIIGRTHLLSEFGSNRDKLHTQRCHDHSIMRYNF